FAAPSPRAAMTSLTNCRSRQPSARLPVTLPSAWTASCAPSRREKLPSILTMVQSPLPSRQAVRSAAWSPLLSTRPMRNVSEFMRGTGISQCYQGHRLCAGQKRRGRIRCRSGPLQKVVMGSVALGAGSCCGHGFRGRVAERKLTAIRELDLSGRGTRIAVMRTECLDDNVRARGQRIPVPAAAEQRARRTAFDRAPLGLAVAIDVGVDPGVGIDPVEPYGLAFESDRLVAVEFGGEGMMGNGGAGPGGHHCSADEGGAPTFDT